MIRNTFVFLSIALAAVLPCSADKVSISVTEGQTVGIDRCLLTECGEGMASWPSLSIEVGPAHGRISQESLSTEGRLVYISDDGFVGQDELRVATQVGLTNGKSIEVTIQVVPEIVAFVGKFLPGSTGTSGDNWTEAGWFETRTGIFHLCNEIGNNPDCEELPRPAGPTAVGATPLVGDWDGDGNDDLGLFQPSTARFRLYLLSRSHRGEWRLRLRHNFHLAFEPGEIPIVGDWDGDGIDTIAAYSRTESGSALRLRATNTAGPVGSALAWSHPADITIPVSVSSATTPNEVLFAVDIRTYDLLLLEPENSLPSTIDQPCTHLESSEILHAAQTSEGMWRITAYERNPGKLVYSCLIGTPGHDLELPPPSS